MSEERVSVEVDQNLLPIVGDTYSDDIGRVLTVRVVDMKDVNMRHVQGNISFDKSRHSQVNEKTGQLSTYDVGVPPQSEVPYSTTIDNFNRIWRRP